MNISNAKVLLGSLVCFLLVLNSCSSDDDRTVESIPFTADIFQSINGKRVAFQGLTNNATSWNWDFGDGTTSTDKNPIHAYAEGGYYTAVLTAADAAGSSIVKQVELAIEITPYVLLTGGATAESGKTWKLSSAHSEGDYFGNADAELTPFDGAPAPLPAGIFGAGLGMGEVYEDEFTFYFDGSYSQDVKADGAVFSGLLYQFVSTGGAGIVNDGGADFGLCTGMFTPETDATFTYAESENLTISSVYGPGGMLTYNGVSTLDFSGESFIGLKDFQQKVIIQDITDNTMRLVMFLAASQDFIGVNTNAVILTFEVVK
ncbi:PKD domain-containing protein [Aurantibacter crassamenti]|uniref:PKD domain-containing protein n=1 Tax=Aurantibacter crassamenti TaxID=1837375 RepID=UPI00193A9266|nr:PKD domain-containing protein [Aurantibacter crassamenti]MBM1105120.1 PKD domain-containing protein [Aurantibacter crassamenti]